MSRSAPAAALLSTCAAVALALPAAAMEPQDILERVCANCHAPREDGSYPRIDDGRRTPEAWDMTLVRMMRNHDVKLDDDERVAMVQFLSDSRGLSVAETEGWRYILEKDPVASDDAPNEQMQQMCGRCHSYARVALERRTREDWQYLINFHLGQFPTLEYQALARDRDWWGIANGEVLDFLSENYGYGERVEASDADLSGDWSIAGRVPGKGDYDGNMLIEKEGDGYALHMHVMYADGDSAHFEGQGVLLGAGEWRATLSDGATEIRQVLALGADGGLSGRWFETDRDVIGGRLTAAKEDAAPEILAAMPAHLRLGETTEIRLTGVGLSGAPTLPEGLSAEVVSESPTDVVLKVTVDAAAPKGPVSIGLGDLAADVVLYDRLDRIAVVPDLTISRVGGNGGPLPKVPAQFEAMGYLNGPDGTPETEDDVAVGYFPAAWSTENFDEMAAAMEDAKYAGSIDANGLFTPGDAGPNPARPMTTNNAGNLWVVAEVEEGGETLEGRAHLYATVQRFVDTPIR
jgi:quinohemoprotein amine dehydrogenase